MSMHTPACSSWRARKAAGFSLVEVTIALGLAAFGILAIFALLPTGINSSSDAVRNTVAANLASAIVSDLQATPASTNYSAIYGLAPDSAQTNPLYLKSDGSKESDATTADFRAEVVTAPSATTQISQVRIKVGWPALAANPVNNFEIVTSIDRFSTP